MFEKAQIDALFGELDREWRGNPSSRKISGMLTWASLYGTLAVHWRKSTPGR
jgi:hypothetical protein